jgi:hypothetical protein
MYEAQNLRVSQVQTSKGRAFVQVRLYQGIPAKGKGKYWAAVTSNLNSDSWKSAFPAAAAVADTVEKNWTRILANRMSQLQAEAKKREAKKGNAKACVQGNAGEYESGAGHKDDASSGEDEPAAVPDKQMQ